MKGYKQNEGKLRSYSPKEAVKPVLTAKTAIMGVLSLLGIAYMANDLRNTPKVQAASFIDVTDQEAGTNTNQTKPNTTKTSNQDSTVDFNQLLSGANGPNMGGNKSSTNGSDAVSTNKKTFDNLMNDLKKNDLKDQYTPDKWVNLMIPGKYQDVFMNKTNALDIWVLDNGAKAYRIAKTSFEQQRILGSTWQKYDLKGFDGVYKGSIDGKDVYVTIKGNKLNVVTALAQKSWIENQLFGASTVTQKQLEERVQATNKNVVKTDSKDSGIKKNPTIDDYIPNRNNGDIPSILRMRSENVNLNGVPTTWYTCDSLETPAESVSINLMLQLGYNLSDDITKKRMNVTIDQFLGDKFDWKNEAFSLTDEGVNGRGIIRYKKGLDGSVTVVSKILFKPESTTLYYGDRVEVYNLNNGSKETIELVNGTTKAMQDAKQYTPPSKQ